MLKTLTIIIHLVFICSYGFAQNNQQEIDSLKHQLSLTNINDTSRVKILTQLCRDYAYSIPDTSVMYGQKALALATQIKFIPGEMHALGELGFTLTVKGNLPQALKMQFQVLQIAEENQLLSETGLALNNIGIIYGNLKDYPKSLSYFLQSLRVSETINDKERIANEKMNVGGIFLLMDQLDSASFYITQSYDEMQETQRGVTSYCYKQMGRMAFKKGNDSLALHYFQKALQKAGQENEFRNLALIYNDISDLYQHQNRVDSSIYFARLALAEAEKVSYKQQILRAGSLLAGLYEPTDTKEALRYYKLAANAKDSLLGAGNIQGIETLVNQEQERRKEIDASKVAYQNQLKEYAFLTGFAMLFLIAFFLYRNNRKEKKAKNLLQAKNKEIEKALHELRSTQAQLIQSEKMASLGELTAGIAHEIQNPLNFVNNFSEVSNELIFEMNQELDKGEIDVAKAIASDIQQNLEKINHHGKRADAIVKGMLQHSSNSNGIKEPTNINALADEYLRLAYHGIMGKDNSLNVTMKTDFDGSIGNINIIPQDIGRVLLNLYNNAFYAINEKKKGGPLIPEGGKENTRNEFGKGSEGGVEYEPTVSVSTKITGDKIFISVRDNGNGIPQKVVDKIFQPFFTTKPAGQGTGLGLSISYDIVKAHSGEIKVETTEGEGSTIIIQMPF